MDHTFMDKLHRATGLVLVSAVTVCLLAFVFTQAAKGLPGLPAVVVYAFAAGFGLEFMGAAWTGRFGRDGHRQLQN